jgi:hypothetical protein
MVVAYSQPRLAVLLPAMLHVYLHACQPDLGKLPLLKQSGRLFSHCFVHYQPTVCALYYLSVMRSLPYYPRRVQQRVTEGSTEVTHGGSQQGCQSQWQGCRASPEEAPFPGVDICFLCCLQVRRVCSASRRHACHQYQPSRQLAESRPGTFML